MSEESRARAWETRRTKYGRLGHATGAYGAETRKLLVTCIQERLDNLTLTVRLGSDVLGTIVQDSRHSWLAREKPPPEPHACSSLLEAVNWLVEQHLANDRLL